MFDVFGNIFAVDASFIAQEFRLPAVGVREGLKREDRRERGGRRERESMRNDTPEPEVTVKESPAHERGSRSRVLEAVHKAVHRKLV